MAKFTAFCQQASGGGTIWIDEVEADNVDLAIAFAIVACADAWDYQHDDVHCLGIAAGDVEILHWEDLSE